MRKPGYITGGRTAGKSELARLIEAQYIREHPAVTILRWRDGEAVVEKPVKAVEEPLPALPRPT